MKTKHLILLVAFLGMFIQMNGQTTSPTLEQTMSFISLKCMDIRWAFTKGDIGGDITREYRFGTRPNDKIYLKDKTLYILSKESGSSFQAELIISVNLVEGISLVDDKYVRIYSSKPFFTFNMSFKNDRPLLDDKNIYIGLFNEGDAPKVYKAFKHLIDLLGVKLNDDIF